MVGSTPDKILKARRNISIVTKVQVSF